MTEKIPDDFVLREVLENCGWNIRTLEKNDFVTKHQLIDNKIVELQLTVKEAQNLLEEQMNIMKKITKNWFT